MDGTIWCLHGAVGMAGDWRGLVVPRWGVKRVDLWRFLECCPLGLAEFGRALNEEAAATPGRKVLLGYSMGGRLALHALLAGFTERHAPGTDGSGTLQPSSPWDAAVIVSAHPGLESRDERVARLAADAEWAARALRDDWRGFLRDWNGQAVLQAAPPGGEVMTLDDRTRLGPRRREVARSFVDWSLGVQEPLEGRLPEFPCPVLWVAGERDARFRALAERVARVGGFRQWIAPGAGHRVPWESAEFPARVGEFLEQAVS